MSTGKQAKKRIRQNEKRRMHNKAIQSKMRTLVKQVLAAAESGDKATAQTAHELGLQNLAVLGLATLVGVPALRLRTFNAGGAICAKRPIPPHRLHRTEGRPAAPRAAPRRGS